MTALSDLNEQVSARGFAVLRRFATSMHSAEAFACLGTIDMVEGLNPVQTLAPHPSEQAPPNTYSGNFGTAEFPLHTDLAHWATPPRFVALRCLRGGDRVTTRVLDGRMLIETLGVEALRMALVQPRRPLRNGKQLLRLLERFGDRDEFLLRWDNLYLRPATRLSQGIFADALNLLSCISIVEVLLLDPGDTLIIDNWRTLHGRSSVPENSLGRHIKRSYIKELR